MPGDPEPFRRGNEQLQDVVRDSQCAAIRVVIERMSEEIQKDVADDGHAAAWPVSGRATEVSAEVGWLGVRLTAEGSPGCEIDSEASTHLFVSRV